LIVGCAVYTSKTSTYATSNPKHTKLGDIIKSSRKFTEFTSWKGATYLKKMKTSSSSFVTGLLAGVTISAAAYISILISSKKQQQRDKSSKDQKPAPRRFGGAIKLKPEMYNRYTQLHDSVWDEVLKRMKQSNIRNFTIYYHSETNTLFSHFEWIGHWSSIITHTNDDNGNLDAKEREKRLFESDMTALSNDPIVREWWSYCEPCQEPFSQWIRGSRYPSLGGGGDWWAPLACLCHCGHWPVDYSDRSRDPEWTPMNLDRLTSSRLKPPAPMNPHVSSAEQ